MTPRLQVTALVAVLVLAGAVDFAKRVFVPRSPATRVSELETPILPDPPMQLASARQRLQSWFSTQTPGLQAAPTDTGPGGPDIVIPDRADIAGWRFVLRGVFGAGSPFAVFDVVSSEGGIVEQHRLSVGETIKGVRLEEISGRSVSLSDGENAIQLALFIDPKDNVAPINEQD